MRNPERISPLWDKLFEAFKKAHSIYPDWRFGQFLVNFLGWYGRDAFFPEDDEWLKIIDQYIAKAGYGHYDPKWTNDWEVVPSKTAKTASKTAKTASKSQKSASKTVKSKAGVTTAKMKKHLKVRLKRKRTGDKNG